MRPSEVVHARVDALTEGLTTAVRKTDGAQFALMLSMISESQTLAQTLEKIAETGSEPAAQAIENRDELYTPEIVGRLSTALQQGRGGDLQMMLSWLETVPLSGRSRPRPALPAGEQSGVSFSQAAVMAAQYGVLDEIRDSRVRLAA